LSQRLGTDEWFLGSGYVTFSSKEDADRDDSGFSGPTPLDALAFAYLHSILHSSDNIRIEVSRRANLLAWEQRVRKLVSAAFTS
jgi:metaxin